MLVIVVSLAALVAWYVNDYYHADTAAISAMTANADDGIEVHDLDCGIAFEPATPLAGLVFYPGAKVQPEAYAPLMRRCAREGVLCVIVRPPFNLALLDTGAAAEAMAHFPAIETWIIAGHSMGGVAAADFVSQHSDESRGIALLASYPTADLSKFPGKAITVIGTNDAVINRERRDAAVDKLPAQTSEIEIVGGNHALYGDYGNQVGDGDATITADEQQAQTANAIAELARAA